MRGRQLGLSGLVTTAVLSALLIAPADGAPWRDASRDGSRGGSGGGQAVPQTSDGRRGEQAAPYAGRRVDDVWTTVATATIAPGVGYEQFTLTGERGVTRGQLMRIDPATPGLGFDLIAPRNVAARKVVTDMVDPDAVVAVNGDFFDILDTEAPLGVALDRDRGLLNGVEAGWNSAFWTDAAGVPHIGDVYADAVVKRRPDLDITTINSPSVRPGQIGLYTKTWGTLRNYRVVDGQRRGVRMVVVRDGRVVANRTRFPKTMRVTDTVLVGRASGAAQLRSLGVGRPVRIKTSLSEDAAMAVTGNLFLLRDGARVADDDKDLHPRTAIGIDRDTGQVLLLVVDGRQELSRGSTMRELATLFTRLGVEDALNLDGGGSSIMVARQADGTMGILNSPSGGNPRPVANGLEVTCAPEVPPAS